MIFIDNDGVTNPKLNLALEEFAMRNFSPDSDYLLFYINEPSIIIGRNQNTLEEINQEYITNNNIHVVRRVSGGGAVYHDLGNLNFSFITTHDIRNVNNFKKFTEPVIKVLKSLGLDAELKGRNDIQVEERKISGTAQFTNGKRMISHGTLLFNTDLGEVANALNVKMSKIQSKGHKSVRSRVANISEFMDQQMDMATFRSLLLKGLNEESEPFEHYHLSPEEWTQVRQLMDEKYDNWDWNYGHSPRFNIQRTKRFPIGEIDLRVFIEKGYITDFKIYGDFFGAAPIEELEQKFKNVRYELEDLKTLLEDVDVKSYFGDIDKVEFIELVYGDDEEN